MHGLENNIRMDLKGIVWDFMCWLHVGQYGDQWRALVNTVLNLRLP